VGGACVACSAGGVGASKLASRLDGTNEVREPRQLKSSPERGPLFLVPLTRKGTSRSKAAQLLWAGCRGDGGSQTATRATEGATEWEACGARNGGGRRAVVHGERPDARELIHTGTPGNIYTFALGVPIACQGAAAASLRPPPPPPPPPPPTPPRRSRLSRRS